MTNIRHAKHGLRWGMRARLHLSAFTLALTVGAVSCSEDPIAGDSDAADTETGDGDGDTGNGDPDETLVLGLFNQTCAPTTTWTSHTVGLMAISIPCDMVGLQANGWTVRYVELTFGDAELAKVNSLVAGLPDGQQIRGMYSLADVPDPHTLEFRADLLLACADSDADCVGRFALAIADGIPDGAFLEIADSELASGMEVIEIAVPLDELQSLAEPSIVLVAERTEPGDDASPEVLVVNPRLVLP
jgi:hypothetical protein